MLNHLPVVYSQGDGCNQMDNSVVIMTTPNWTVILAIVVILTTSKCYQYDYATPI